MTTLGKRKVRLLSQNFAIDENDYATVRKILIEMGCPEKDKLIKKSCWVNDDNDRRVFGLKVQTKKNFSLPDAVRQLAHLRVLDVSGTTSLPFSIGDLDKLERLKLSGPMITSLPSSIGRLTCLKILDLKSTSIVSLPPTVGNLQNLENLRLPKDSFQRLPEEIGELVCLKKLNLSCFSYFRGPQQLPPSIGRLRNLVELNLRYTNLLELPEEIGNLDSLQRLLLHGSKIESLPCSIGRLKRLEFLDLDRTTLKYQDEDTIKTIGSVKTLQQGIDFPHDRFFLRLVHGCPSLVCLGRETEHCHGSEKVLRVLEHNRARSRTQNLVARPVVPNLWSYLLSNSTNRLFDRCDLGWYCRKPRSTHLDAIHHILTHCRESFAILLIDRNSKKSSQRWSDTNHHWN